MTPEQHNKYLSYAHFAYAGLTALFMAVGAVFFAVGMSADPNSPPPAFFIILSVFFAFIVGFGVFPSLVAGYALMKRKRWAKTAAIAAGVVASLSAPVGTALCVYTFWFLFSQPGKLLYESPTRELSQQPDVWGLSEQARSQQYVPPASPPDWR